MSDTYDARFDHHSPEYDPSCINDIEPDEEPSDTPNYWSNQQEPASADNPNEDDEPDYKQAIIDDFELLGDDDDEEDINPQDQDIENYNNEQSESDREDMENE